jgi:hypothetical protein
MKENQTSPGGSDAPSPKVSEQPTPVPTTTPNTFVEIPFSHGAVSTLEQLITQEFVPTGAGVAIAPTVGSVAKDGGGTGASGKPEQST